MTNARGHVTPDGLDVSVSRGTIFDAFGNSIRDIPSVANTTARAQLVSDLTDEGQAPSSTKPLYVYRADAPGLHRIEYTSDGSVWVPTSGVLRFSDNTARDSWTTSNAGLLSVGDRCLSNGVEFRWDGDSWEPPVSGTPVLVSTFGTAVAAGSVAPPMVWAIGDTCFISGTVVVSTGYNENFLMEIPAGFRLNGSRADTMIGTGLSNTGKVFELYMLKSNHRVQIVWKTASAGNGEQLAITGFWRRDV